MGSVVYESEKMQIVHHEDSQILEQILSHGEDDEEIFKAEVLDFLNYMESCKPRRTLWDMRNLSFIVSPDLEGWIDENINAKEVAFGIEREAFIISDVYAAEIGVEETMENEFGAQLNTSYFISREEAIAWLSQ